MRCQPPSVRACGTAPAPPAAAAARRPAPQSEPPRPTAASTPRLRRRGQWGAAAGRLLGGLRARARQEASRAALTAARRCRAESRAAAPSPPPQHPQHVHASEAAHPRARCRTAGGPQTSSKPCTSPFPHPTARCRTAGTPAPARAPAAAAPGARAASLRGVGRGCAPCGERRGSGDRVGCVAGPHTVTHTPDAASRVTASQAGGQAWRAPGGYEAPRRQQRRKSSSR